MMKTIKIRNSLVLGLLALGQLQVEGLRVGETKTHSEMETHGTSLVQPEVRFEYVYNKSKIQNFLSPF